MIFKQAGYKFNSKKSLRLTAGIKALLIALCTFTFLSSCAVGGFSEMQTFQGVDHVNIQEPREDILDIVAETGQSMGYNVSALNREIGTISLRTTGSAASRALFAKVTDATLRISKVDNGRRLNIDYMFMGNLGSGGQEAAMEAVDNFKEELLKRLE